MIATKSHGSDYAVRGFVLDPYKHKCYVIPATVLVVPIVSACTPCH